MNPNPKSKEVLQGSPDEKITINSVDELKKQLNISTLPDNLKDFFEQPLETTKGELLNLRKKYLQEEPNIDTIKSFLTKAKQSVVDEARIQIEKTKKVTQGIKKSVEIDAKKMAEGKKDGKEAETMMDSLVETANSTVDKVTGSEVVKQGGEAMKKGAEKAKQTAKKGVETLKKSEGMVSFIASLEKLKEKGGIGGFFATILLFIFSLLGFSKDKLKKKAKEKTKEVLESKEAQEVRTKIIESIQKDILKLKGLSPKLVEELEKILKDPSIISEENLIELQKKLKSNGKLTLLDLKYILGPEKFEKLQAEIFSPEIREQLKAEAEDKIVEQIYKTYNLDLRMDKRAELEKLVQKYIKVDNFIVLKEKLEGEGVSLGDLLGVTFSEGGNIALFAIEAVAKGIIGPGKLIIYAGKKGTETISLGLAGLGVKDDINLDKFKEQVQNMNSIERGLLLGTLYRHTGFLSTILGEITQTSTRLLIEGMSSAPVSSTKAGWAALRGNVDKQTQVFMKLEEIFGQSAGTETIKSSLKEIQKLKTNNEIIRLLNESNNDITTFKNLLSKLDTSKLDKDIINTIKNIDTNDFPKLREEISTKVTSLKNTGISTTLKNKLSQLGFPVSKYEYEFYKNTDDILRYQREAIKTGVLSKVGKFWTKLGEIQGYSNLSRDLEKLHFENLSKSQALTKMQALKKLFLDFPELSKSFFGAVPEIAFFGLALSSKKEDESFMETMLDTMLYMIPVVGPIKMVLSAKASLNEEGVQWYNIAESTAGVALLGIDASYIVKTSLGGGSSTEKVLKIGSHILKPITSPYKFGRDLVKAGVNIYDVVKAEGEINWGQLVKRSKNILKQTKGGKWATILGIAAISGYVAHEIFKDDLGEEFKQLVEKGIIDNQGHIKDYKKLKEEFIKMDLDEKEAMIEVIFLMASVSTSGLKFKLTQEGKLKIISYDERIKSDWILKDPEGNILKTLNSLGFSYKDIDFEYKGLV